MPRPARRDYWIKCSARLSRISVVFSPPQNPKRSAPPFLFSVFDFARHCETHGFLRRAFPMRRRLPPTACHQMIGWLRGLDCQIPLLDAVLMQMFPCACAPMHRYHVQLFATTLACSHELFQQVRLSADRRPGNAAQGLAAQDPAHGRRRRLRAHSSVQGLP